MDVSSDDAAASAAGRSSNRIEAVVYPRGWRLAVGVLRAVSGGSLLAILALLMAPGAEPLASSALIRLVTSFCLLPGLAAFVVRRVFAGVASVRDESLVLEHRFGRTEIPLASIVGVEPWLVPLPGSGVSIRLRSGKLWGEGLEIGDPIELIETLADACHSARLRGAARHAGLVYARARSKSRRPSWYGPLLKFPIFALVPAVPFFRVHQIIAYGGALGEYYQYGLNAYLAGFAVYWATLTIYLMVYAAALRAGVELVAALSVPLAPRRAAGARRILERASGVLYYVGVPVAVVLRFVPW